VAQAAGLEPAISVAGYDSRVAGWREATIPDSRGAAGAKTSQRCGMIDRLETHGSCVARAGGRTGDAVGSLLPRGERLLEEVVRHRMVNCARTGMNSCAPSTNCWKSVHR